jgi:hypothetical protein
MSDPTGPEWDAAVEAGAQSLYRLGWNMSEAEGAAEHILTAALPNLRRHVIAELRERAEAEAKGAVVIDGTPVLGRPAMAARWLSEQGSD